MDHLTTYLSKSAGSRTRTELRLGNLTPETKELLRRSGVLPSTTRWAEGLAAGANNRLLKDPEYGGYTSRIPGMTKEYFKMPAIRRPIDPLELSPQGALTLENWRGEPINAIHVEADPTLPQDNSLFVAHEADEFKFRKSPPSARIGTHRHPKVLLNEYSNVQGLSEDTIKRQAALRSDRFDSPNMPIDINGNRLDVGAGIEVPDLPSSTTQHEWYQANKPVRKIKSMPSPEANRAKALLRSASSKLGRTIRSGLPAVDLAGLPLGILADQAQSNRVMRDATKGDAVYETPMGQQYSESMAGSGYNYPVPWQPTLKQDVQALKQRQKGEISSMWRDMPAEFKATDKPVDWGAFNKWRNAYKFKEKGGLDLLESHLRGEGA